MTGNSNYGIILNGRHSVATINYWGLTTTAIMGIASNPKDIFG